jgi:hypothetical protein
LRIAGDGGAIAAAETRDGVLVERKLARRQQPDLVECILGALGLGIEHPDPLDLVVEQIDPQRHPTPHGEDIQERAPHRIFAVSENLRDTGIACLLQAAAHGVAIKPLADGQYQRMAIDIVTRRQTLHQGGDRDDQQTRLQGRQTIQGKQSLRDQLGQGREDVVGEGLPIGKVEERRLASVQEEAQFSASGRSGLDAIDHHQDQSGVACGDPGDRQRGAGTIEPAPELTFTRATRQRWVERRVQGAG